MARAGAVAKRWDASTRAGGNASHTVKLVQADGTDLAGGSATLNLASATQDLLARLKSQIQTAQVRAAVAVNRELVLLYWSIENQILERQTSEGWGKNVIPRLSRDLAHEFPEMKGLSPRNLGYMKAFAEAWPDESILQQLAAKLPWFHNCVLLDKVKEPGVNPVTNYFSLLFNNIRKNAFSPVLH